MSWDALLRLPTTIMLVVAGLLLLFSLVQLVRLRQHVRAGRSMAATWRSLLLIVGLCLTVLLAGGAWTLRGYRFLSEESPVVQVDAHILSPQRYALTLTWPDGSTRDIELDGDAFRVEALVLKWKLPAVLAGAPPLYRLDRIDGRYDDAEQERTAPRTVIDFNPSGHFDLLALSRRHPQWLSAVDTVYGSGAFLPLVDAGHYSVSLMRTGALVARPDAATAQRLAQRLGRY